LVFNTVTVKSIGKSQLQIEWKSDNTGDMIADSVLAVLLQIEGSPASVRMTESVSLQKKKKINYERVNKPIKSELYNDNIKKEMRIKSENIDNDNIKEDSIKQKIENIKKELGSDDIKMEEINKELDDKSNIKTEIVDAMDVDPSEEKTENEKSSNTTEKETNNDDSLNDHARKVMFHNIMENSHIPLEEDMEFELYMYKFLCMQFGVENVTSENMSLPIMLDYFGSEGVTYNMYDNETSKLTIGVDNSDIKNKKIDKNEKQEIKSSDKKLWKVHIDNYSCTIDRKTLEINSNNENLRKRVLNVVSRVKKILRPLSETWSDLLNNNNNNDNDNDTDVSENEEEEEEEEEEQQQRYI